MPSRNPLFTSWSLKKFNATIINDIWPEVMFFTLVATMVALVSNKTDTQLIVPTTLLTVLGTVLGLVISFRTSTAYERYQDGRKMWTNITIASRNLAQMIWIHVPSEREPKPGQAPTTVLQNVIEKKTMINLIQAYAVSLKHYLRAEPGIYYRDLYPLVCVLPRYASSSRAEADLLPLWYTAEGQHEDHPDQNIRDAGHEKAHRTTSLPTPEAQQAHSDSQSDTKAGGSWMNNLRRDGKKKKKFDPELALPTVSSSRPLKPARLPPKTSLYDYIPLLRLFKWIFRRASSKVSSASGRTMLGKKAKPVIVDSNVPLEVLLHLSAYSAWLMKGGMLQPAIATGVTNSITTLLDTFSNLDRIGTTPLPFAYQVHLRMSLWLYLLFLPFQIWKDFKWLTIPGTAFASFLLLGFLEIGQEIENPFSYDTNDLDLDSFCLSIQRELHEITAHAAPNPNAFVFSAWNQPFAPSDRRTAEELLKDGGTAYSLPNSSVSASTDATKESIHLTLLRSWKDVESMTREKK